MKYRTFLPTLLLAMMSQGCFHGYEARLFNLKTSGIDDRVRLADDSHRLLVETEGCSFMITPAYLGPLVIWVEEDPLLPCQELTLQDVALTGQAVQEPVSYFVHSDESMQGSFPFTFKGTAQVEANVKWSGIPDSERLFRARIEIQVDGDPLQVAFQAVRIEPKWLIAKPFWQKDR